MRLPLRRSTLLLMLLAGLAAAPARAQPPTPDYAGLFQNSPPVQGRVAIRAESARRWTSAGVQRLVLTGRVRLSLGDHEFHAARAVVWLWTSPLGSQPRTSVFAHLEDVGDPAEPVGLGVSSSRALSVRGVFISDQGPSLSAGLVRDGAPSSDWPDAERACLASGEEAISTSVKRARGEPVATDLPPLPTFRGSTFTAPTPAKPRPLIPWPGAALNPPPVDTPPTRPAGPSQTPPSLPIARPPAIVPPRPSVSPPAPGPSTQSPATGPAAGPGPQPPQPPVRPPVQTSAPVAPPAPIDAIFSPGGVVSLSPRNFSVVLGEDETAVTAWGGVALQYLDVASGRSLQLSAQRAVVFLDPGQPGDLAGLRSESVRGIYLEGEVTATDGNYTLRGPQIYYDLRTNRAVMPDAVFWTYDQQRELPVYVRAKVIRQTAAETFEGEGAQLTNSAFFNPELSIGASKITISRRTKPASAETGAPATSALWVDARDITGRIAGVPVTYWPRYAGDPEERIIKDLRVENRSSSGGAVLSTINAYALLGLETPRNFSLDVLADFYFERGPALGVKSAWGDPQHSGSLQAYTVPFDRGTDVYKSGAKTNRDNEFRGVLFAEQRWTIDPEWTAFGKVAFISDAGVIDAFFEDLGETRREFTNRLAVRRLRANTYLGAEISGTLADFIANEYLLTSQGYSVTRTPEASYVRLADDVLPQSAPGVLSYFSEYRLGRVSIAMDEASAREHGLFFNSTSLPGLGIGPDDSIAESLRTQGYFEKGVIRADTRQELAAHLRAGPVNINPFIVGRVSFWDSSFPEFSPDEDDHYRLWGAGGVRLSTMVQRVDDTAYSALLDIHRLRHVVEPNATLWFAGTTLDRADLPVYDQAVEDLPHGGMARVGVTQRLQTQRGGPGRWHNTDLLTLSTDLVFSTTDAGHRGPYGRFIDFRPELSNPGDFGVADLAVRITDATSFTASSVYDLDDNQQAASSIGLLFRQYPEFWASVDLRFLNPQDSTYLTFGLGYDLTEKYTVRFGAAYDTDESRFQNASLLLTRRFQSTLLGLGISTNEITGETSIGVVIRPYGAGGEVGLSNMGSRLGGE